MYKAQDIIDFWFHELEPRQWWEKDATFDRLIAERFAGHYQAAIKSELYTWRESAEGQLAEIIILDQFSRNIYRDKAESFAMDNMALSLAQTAVSQGRDKDLEQAQRAFLYMPYMHSESVLIHEVAVILFSDLGNESNLNFELHHKTIIDRFGRYPHRNAILGRNSTEEERLFLQQPNSSF